MVAQAQQPSPPALSSSSSSSAASSSSSELNISVTVVEARGLVANDAAPLDVYCRVCVGGAVEQTPVARRTRGAPVWHATLEFELVGGGDELVLELFAADRFAYDEPLGLGIVRLGDLQSTADRWVPFIDAPAGRSGSGMSGEAGKGGEVHVVLKPIREAPLDARLTLGVAVRDGSVRAVTRLLRDASVDVNAQDAFGYAPLHTAVTMGDAVLRPLLACARVNVNLRNADGNTPFHYFCAKWRTPNCAPLFDQFIGKGALINAQNNTGETPLHKAVMNGFVRLILVRMLLAHGADPNLLSSKGEAPLHYAVYLKRDDVILSLVQGGADVSLRGKGGKTAYGLAVDTGETRIARLLSDVKALFDWLAELGLDEYRGAFIEHEIFLPVLPALDDDTLDVLGVTALGHRLKLLDACALLRERERAGLDVKAHRRLTVNTTPAGLRMEAELAALSHVDGSAGGWLVSHQELEFTELLGEGASGAVYRGLFRDRVVAVKVLSGEARTEKRINEFKREFEILAAVRSPYLVQFYAASLEPQLSMVIEYCAMGSLFHVMIRPPLPPPPAAADSAAPSVGVAPRSTIEAITTGLLDWRWFFDIASDAVRGIDVLHNWQPPIVHRDLKSLNLLVDAAGRTKVCDFGLSRFTTGSNLMSLQKCRGTLAYTAPEMMDAVQFQPAADMYALGMVLWEMATRLAKGVYERPYEEFPNLRLDFQILVQASQGVRPTLSPALPAPIRALIQRLWSADPTVRPLTAELLVELQALRRASELDRAAWDAILSHFELTAQSPVLSDGGNAATAAAAAAADVAALVVADPDAATSPRASLMLVRAGSPTNAQRMLRRDLIRGVSAVDHARPAVVDVISRARNNSGSSSPSARFMSPAPASPALATPASSTPSSPSLLSPASPTVASPSRRATLQRNARIKQGLNKRLSVGHAPLSASALDHHHHQHDDDDNDGGGGNDSDTDVIIVFDGPTSSIDVPTSATTTVVVDDDSDSSFDFDAVSSSMSRQGTLGVLNAKYDDEDDGGTSIKIEPLQPSSTQTSYASLLAEEQQIAAAPTPVKAESLAAAAATALSILTQRSSSASPWGSLLAAAPAASPDAEPQPTTPRRATAPPVVDTSTPPPLPSAPPPQHLSRQAQALRFPAKTRSSPPTRSESAKPLPPSRPPPMKTQSGSKSSAHLVVSPAADDDVPPPPPPASGKPKVRDVRSSSERDARPKSPRPDMQGHSQSDRARASTGSRRGGRKRHTSRPHKRQSESSSDASDDAQPPVRVGTPEIKPPPPPGKPAQQQQQ